MNKDTNTEIALISKFVNSKNFKDKDFWYLFGYKYGGPVALGYVEFIISQTKNMDFVLFVSRDGYILQKIFNYLLEDKAPNNCYVYAPRSLALKCFLDWGGQFTYLKEIMKLTQGICPAFKNIPDNFKDAVSLFEQNKDKLSDFSKKNYLEYKKYFDSLNIKGENFAVVDMVSGAFSAQRFLDKFLQKPSNGIYFATYNHYSGSIKHSVFYDKYLEPKDSFKVNILELLITAPEFPVKDIKDGLPVYNDKNIHDKTRKNIYPEIEKGILDFVKDYNEKYNNQSISSNTIYKILEKLVNHPDKTTKKHLKNIYYTPDAFGEEFLEIFGIKARITVFKDTWIIRYINAKKFLKSIIISLKYKIIKKR